MKNILITIGIAGILIGWFFYERPEPPFGGASPYTDKGDRLELKFQSSLEGSGDSKIEFIKSRPEVRLKKWNGEVDLGIEYKKIQASGVTNSEKMEWKSAKEELHAYSLSPKDGMEDGGLEIEVILKEKPDTNIFVFQLDSWENFNFFYQAPLTSEEMSEGELRPENVVGSYAVYHKTNSNHIEGQTNYSTGKAFHIYRPKAIDNNGVEQWAIMSYLDGVISVEVPQSFLDSAEYPVRVDPTIGYTSIGATDGGLLPNTIRISIPQLANDNAFVNTLYVYDSLTTARGAARGVVYASSSKALIDAGTEEPGGTDTGWIVYDMDDQPITRGVTYGLGLYIGGEFLTARYDSVSGFQLRRDDFTYHATNDPNNPFVVDATLADRQYSIYASYTVNTISKTLIKGGQVIIQGGQIQIQ